MFFFFNDTATTEIYTLSLHDALPILAQHTRQERRPLGLAERRYHRQLLLAGEVRVEELVVGHAQRALERSEEHTSELQSQSNLVCRLLLEKKKKNVTQRSTAITHGRL